MMFTPASVLRLWLCGLLSLAVLAGGVYLLSRWYDDLPRERVLAVNDVDGTARVRPLTTFGERVSAWRPGWNRETAWLTGAAAVLGWTFLGRSISPRLWRRRGTDEPQATRGGEVRRLRRPDGTELNVEFYGPADAAPVLLTHGWGCDSTEWYYTKKHLATFPSGGLGPAGPRAVVAAGESRLLVGQDGGRSAGSAGRNRRSPHGARRP